MRDETNITPGPKRIGLALSGGGYRAAAFHLGTLRKLSKLGILDNVDVLSTVSGGSIIGAYYALHKDNFSQFEIDFTSLLKKSVISQVLLSSPFIRIIIGTLIVLSIILYFLFFTHLPWVSFLLLLGVIFFVIKYQFQLFPVSKIIENIYNAYFFKGAVLGQLPDKPVIVINSSNLQTGRLFSFSKDKIGDSTYSNENIHFQSTEFPISRAVMASSCVPFAFTPVSVSEEYYNKSEKDSYEKPLLIDGGIYDNQGLHKLTHRSNPPRYLNAYECDIIIVSDAGNIMSFGGLYNNVLTLISRTCDLLMRRIKMFQIMQNLYQNSSGAQKEISYISLGWDLGKLIPGFVRNLRDGNIIESVKIDHGLMQEFVSSNNDDKIIKHLEQNIGYSEIIGQNITKEELGIARSVSTNLTALSDEQIEALSKYAELQTEIQVKLYCPSLIVRS